jgi:membrane-bound lytic murein transglycosylase D
MKPKAAAHDAPAPAGPVAQVEGDDSFSWAVDPSATAAASTEVDVPKKESTTGREEATTPRANASVAGAATSTPETSPSTTSRPSVSTQTGVTESNAPAVLLDQEPLTETDPKAETITGTEGAVNPAPAADVTNTESKSTEPTETSSVVATTITPPDSVGVVKTTPTPLPTGKSTHTVLAGETLYAIAREHNVGVMDIVNWNGLNLQEGIKPGQVLKLRPLEEQTVATSRNFRTIEHIVRSTDTLYSVARKYNVTIKELMDWNNKKDFSLAIGEKLIVKGQ